MYDVIKRGDERGIGTVMNPRFNRLMVRIIYTDAVTKRGFDARYKFIKAAERAGSYKKLPRKRKQLYDEAEAEINAILKPEGKTLEDLIS